jgi:beta-lactamase class A
MIKKVGLWPAVEKQNLSLVLVDITDLHHPRVAAIRGDTMVYAASLPKIAILLAAFVQIEQNKLTLDDNLMRDMTAMIRKSNNAAATRVLSLVGRKELLSILKSFRFRLYDPEHGGGLWVGKDYAKKGAYQRDPIKNLSHAASALQVARFYYLLETNRLVNPELTKIMKEILSKPGISHKFVKGLASIPQAKIYRKSGSWGRYHADSALVESGKYKFIIIGLANHSDGGRWLSKLAAPLHNLIVEE